MSTLNHMRKPPSTIFFKIGNPVFKNELANHAQQNPNIDADGNSTQYIKALEKKYNPRNQQSNILTKVDQAPAICATIKAVEADELIEQCILSPSPFDFAMLLYKFCENQFRCIDIVSQKWQRYNSDTCIWTNDDSCIKNMRALLSGHILNFFSNKHASLKKLSENRIICENVLEAINAKMQNIDYILKRLDTIVMKNAIIKEASLLFFYSEILHS